MSQDHSTIYITEKQHGCIGISVNGEHVFKYKAENVDIYQGVFVDDLGYTFLAEQDNDNIVVVNDKGVKIKDYVTLKGMKPSFIKFDIDSDKLLVVKGKTGRITIFDLN